MPEEPAGDDPTFVEEYIAPSTDASPESLAGLYELIGELRSEMAERDKTEPSTQRPAQPETTADRSAPRLMAADYSLDTGFLSPGTEGKFTVLLKNTNPKRGIFNLKLTGESLHTPLAHVSGVEVPAEQLEAILQSVLQNGH